MVIMIYVGDEFRVLKLMKTSYKERKLIVRSTGVCLPYHYHLVNLRHEQKVDHQHILKNQY